MGLRSRSLKSPLLFLGFTIVVDDGPSSLPFLKFFLISFDRSRIFVRVPLGLSGGRLAALDGVTRAVRLEVEDLTSLATDGREPFKFDLLADLPVDNLSNTVEPVAPLGSFAEADLDNLSIREFLRVTGFFKSLSEWPGLILPEIGSSACSTLIIGTDVTYLPSTNSEL